MEELADCKEGRASETEKDSARPPVILEEGIRAGGAGLRPHRFRVLTPCFLGFFAHMMMTLLLIHLDQPYLA